MVHDLPPADTPDPVLAAYRKDVDITLLRENLQLTAEERFLKFQRFMRSMATLRKAMLDSQQVASNLDPSDITNSTVPILKRNRASGPVEP